MRVGRYDIIEKLGEGGMAEVFLARYEAMAGAVRKVVVKRILPSVVADEQTLALFISEARLTMQLSHGNLVQVFDFGEADGQCFLAMEYVDGLSLALLLHAVRERGLPGVPAPIAVAIIIEVAKGLHFAHSRADEHGAPLHIIHRDVSPENVLISYEGQVKVTDFGIARARLEGRQFTAPGIFRGKPDYAAPEQARAEVQTARVDVYATGLLLAELITGENPQEGRLVQVASEGLRLTMRSPLVDSTMAAIIDAAIDPNPKTRMPSALELQHRLTDWLATNAPIALASGVPNFMAWLDPDALAQRGLSVTVPANFAEWLASWSRNQRTDPQQPALEVSSRRATTVPDTPGSKGNLHPTLPPTIETTADVPLEQVVPKTRVMARPGGSRWLIGFGAALVLLAGVVMLGALESSSEPPIVVPPPAPIVLNDPPVAPLPREVPVAMPPRPPPVPQTARSVAQYPAQVRLLPGVHSVDLASSRSGLKLAQLLPRALEGQSLVVRRTTKEMMSPKLLAATLENGAFRIAQVGSEWTPIDSLQTTIFVFDQRTRLFWQRLDVGVGKRTKDGVELVQTMPNAGIDLIVSVDESQRFELQQLDTETTYQVLLKPQDQPVSVFVIEPGAKRRQSTLPAPVLLVPGRPLSLKGAELLWLTMLAAPGVTEAVVEITRPAPGPVVVRGVPSPANLTTAEDYKRLALEHGARGEWKAALVAWEGCLAIKRDLDCRAGAETARRNLEP